MIETSALALLESTALKDGISFLYEQAGDLLRRRRDRKESAHSPEDAVVSEGSLDGKLDITRVDDKILDQQAAVIAQNRGVLLPYWEGDSKVDPHDERMIAAMAQLRASLEAIYGQAITFTGEKGRSATGTRVSVRAALGDVYGEAEIARMRAVNRAEVEVHVEAGTIGPGGRLKVGEMDQIGSPPAGEGN
jgi:uncharacterized protein Veg